MVNKENLKCSLDRVLGNDVTLNRNCYNKARNKTNHLDPINN